MSKCAKFIPLFKSGGTFSLEACAVKLTQFSSMKSHVSAFLKCDGNIELHVSATLTFCGNVLYQVLAILSSFRHVSGTEMSTHVSVIFKSGRSRCSSFPLCFCNGFLIPLLNLCNENKSIMVLCMVFTILTKLKR